MLIGDVCSDLPLGELEVIDVGPVVIVLPLIVGRLSLTEPFSQQTRTLVDSLGILTHELDHSAAVALEILQIADFGKSVLLARGNSCACYSIGVLLFGQLLVCQFLCLCVIRVVRVLFVDSWAA